MFLVPDFHVRAAYAKDAVVWLVELAWLRARARRDRNEHL
jgi:hypothetical protein